MSEAMDKEERQRLARSYGEGADAYDAYRPGYAVDAVRWLVGTSRATILELGAGTGKLTHTLDTLGHEVYASDRSPAMLATLRRAVKDVTTFVGMAEDIPLRDSSVDVIVAAQAYHWFDRRRTEPEMARVLRAGGLLALMWNNPDLTIPWVRRVFRLMGIYSNDGDPMEASEFFTRSESRTFRHWQQFTRDGLVGFVGSASRVLVMDERYRAQTLARAAELYDEYAQGREGLRLPWTTSCYRSRVLAEAKMDTPPSGDDGLLIDFN
jgi:SAM-dependent methyltransferase